MMGGFEVMAGLAAALVACLALVVRLLRRGAVKDEQIRNQKRQLEAERKRVEIEHDVDQDADLVERARRSGVVRRK